MKKTRKHRKNIIIKESLHYHLKALQDWGVDFIPAYLSTPGDPITNQPSAPTKNLSKKEAITNLKEHIGECSRCPLHSKRINIVFGTGNLDAQLMFIGEGPGADEDKEGEPFVGMAGQLLTKMIEAMGLKRHEVYIANVVKCRPPQNRNPEPLEVETCSPFLMQQIKIITPKVIVALGKFAAQTLLKTAIPISKIRGAFHDFEGIKLMPTYHPAFLLRNANMKKIVWTDLKMVMQELELKSPK